MGTLQKSSWSLSTQRLQNKLISCLSTWLPTTAGLTCLRHYTFWLQDIEKWSWARHLLLTGFQTVGRHYTGYRAKKETTSSLTQQLTPHTSTLSYQARCVHMHKSGTTVMWGWLDLRPTTEEKAHEGNFYWCYFKLNGHNVQLPSKYLNYTLRQRLLSTLMREAYRDSRRRG